MILNESDLRQINEYEEKDLLKKRLTQLEDQVKLSEKDKLELNETKQKLLNFEERLMNLEISKSSAREQNIQNNVELTITPIESDPNEKIKKLEEANEKLRYAEDTKLIFCKNKIKDLETQLQNRNNIENSNKELNIQLDVQRKEISRLKAENQTLEANHKKEINNISIKIIELANANESISKERENLSQLNKDLTEANNGLKSDYDLSLSNLEEQKNSNLVVVCAHNNLKNEYENQQFNLEKLERNNESLNEQKRNFEEEISNLTNIKNELEDIIRRGKDEICSHNRKNSQEYITSDSNLQESPDYSALYELYADLNKIILTLFGAIENFIPFCFEESINQSAFSSLKSNIKKEFSPNMDSFKGYVESLITPLLKIDKGFSNLLNFIDLEKLSNYLLNQGKYSKCLNCEKIKLPSSMTKFDCGCFICNEHRFTKFDLHFHLDKKHN
jgi:chromosome segregation ATPase